MSLEALTKIALMLKNRLVKRVVVMAGAGISTPSGIPDFRSPGTGLYSNVAKYNLPYPEAIFDIDYFRSNPKPFFDLSKSLYPGQYPPNECHWFVRLLQDKNLLLRMYTQNIDGMETLAGVHAEKLVEAHGSYAKATCTVCYEKYESASLKGAVLRGEIPKCKVCQGVVKPDIVFFGEQLPERYMMCFIDLPLADLLIVMGTSLEVYPFAGIASLTLPSVPRLLINKTAVGTFITEPRKNDLVYEGDIVEGVKKLCEFADWHTELHSLKNNYKGGKEL